MVSQHVFYQWVRIILVWMFLMLYGLWPSESAATRRTISQPHTPPRQRPVAPSPHCCPAPPWRSGGWLG
jgi:hypothetical protein